MTARVVAVGFVVRAVRLAVAVLAGRADDARAEGVLRAADAGFARVAVRAVEALTVFRVVGVRVAVAVRLVAGAALARVVVLAGLPDAESLRVPRAAVVRDAVATRLVFEARLAARDVFDAVLGADFGPDFVVVLIPAFGFDVAPVGLAAAFGPGFFAVVARVGVALVVRPAVVRALVPAVRRPPVRTAIARVTRGVILSSLIDISVPFTRFRCGLVAVVCSYVGSEGRSRRQYRSSRDQAIRDFSAYGSARCSSVRAACQ